MTEQPDRRKPVMMFMINLLSCAAGTVFFVFFVLGIERDGSWADQMLQGWLENYIWIVSGLFLLGLVVLLPFLRKRS